MINAIINNEDKTAVVEFPMDLYKLYQDLHEIGFQGGPHRVKLTDNEEDDIRVKLFSDNDFGNHLVLLFNENDTLEDVHTVVGAITIAPDEVKEHCDAIMVNNCGENLKTLLEDLKNNTLKKEYIGTPCIDYKMADRSIYAKQQKKYLPVSLVETGRGCFHNCEFCSISKYYDSKYIHREVADIIAEMKSCRHKLFFLVDDSIFSNKEFARELFTEIKKLKVTWTTQITLDIARDEETLRLMKESGCEMVNLRI